MFQVLGFGVCGFCKASGLTISGVWFRDWESSAGFRVWGLDQTKFLNTSLNPKKPKDP